MHVIKARNVNDAYARGMVYFSPNRPMAPQELKSLESRVGSVRKSIDPVTILYEKPRERVLFDSKRDANPFFHVMESMWMLLGRNDVASITRWIKKFTEFTDDGQVLHGAYGFRWRSHFCGIDQIDAAIKRLTKNRSCRRTFISMYDPETDAFYDGKDMPCNLGIKLWIEDDLLNMHVFNRSNDFIWGATGANVVHMSFLQEFIAGKIGVGVGRYWQTSSDMHVYTGIYDKHAQEVYNFSSPYFEGEVGTIDMNSSAPDFMSDLVHFWEDDGHPIQNEWIMGVLCMMRDSWDLLKEKRYDDAYDCAGEIIAPDWKLACREYISRRVK